MNVAVYSGSFNPLHIGHLAIMKHLIQEADFDMAYLIVSPKNPLKDTISSGSASERYKAAVEAVGRHGLEKVKVERKPKSEKEAVAEVKETKTAKTKKAAVKEETAEKPKRTRKAKKAE